MIGNVWYETFTILLFFFPLEHLATGRIGSSPSWVLFSQVFCIVTTWQRASPPEETLLKSGKHFHLGARTRDLLGACSGALFLSPAICFLTPWNPDGWPDIHLSSTPVSKSFLKSLSLKAPAHFSVSLPLFLLFILFHERLYVSELSSMITVHMSLWHSLW